jgi:hypothetical protein
MAAHQQQIRAARARVKREELVQLGMQFAARLQAPVPAAAQVGALYVLHSTQWNDNKSIQVTATHLACILWTD